MVKASKGTLVQCDSNVKALIMLIDQEDGGGYIVEDLDDRTVLIKETRVGELKIRLREIVKQTVREPPVDPDD